MDDIESRLHAFRPRRPTPLPDHYHFALRRSRAPFWVAVAAAIAVAVLVGGRIARAPVMRDPVFSTAPGPLTTLALTNPEAFDAALAQISRASLPDVGQPGRAFQQLAKQ